MSGKFMATTAAGVVLFLAGSGDAHAMGKARALEGKWESECMRLTQGEPVPPPLDIWPGLFHKKEVRLYRADGSAEFETLYSSATDCREDAAVLMQEKELSYEVGGRVRTSKGAREVDYLVHSVTVSMPGGYSFREEYEGASVVREYDIFRVEKERHEKRLFLGEKSSDRDGRSAERRPEYLERGARFFQARE